MPIRLVDKTGQLGQLSSVLANAVSAIAGTHTLPAGRTGAIASQLGSHVSAFSGAFQANADRTGTISATLDAHTSSIIGGAPSSAEASDGIRFNPGHYMYMDTGSGGGGLAGWIAQINSLSSEPTVTGVQFGTDWSDIETNTRGTYDWSILDSIVNAASAINKKVMLYVKHQYFGTSPTSAAGRFPSWLATIQGGSPGYTAWDGSNPASPPGNLILVAHLWNTSVMTAWIQLGQAIATRYKDNPAFEMLSIGETATANLPGSGYSATAWVARLKDWMTAMRSAWPSTAIRVGTNYLDTDAQMQEVIAHAATLQIACGGPDNFSRVYQSNPIYTGFNGGIDYRDVIPWVGENQRPATSSGGTTATSAQVYAHNETGALSAGGSTKPNYYIWNRNTDSTGGAETWPTHILPFIRSISGACNTTTPASYLGFQYFISTTGSDSNDGRATTRPWAITALNTKQATYASKTVGLMNGTYNIRSLMLSQSPVVGNDTPGLQIRGGTAASPTVIKAVNARQAIITAKSGSLYGNNIAGNAMIGTRGLSTANAEYITIQDLVFTGTNVVAINMHDFNASTRARGITIKNNEIYDIDSSGTLTGGVTISGLNPSGITINTCDGAIVRNNYIHDVYRSPRASSVDHLSAVLVWRSSNLVIEHNKIRDTAWGIYGKEWANEGTIIRYNDIDLTGVTVVYTGVTVGIADFVGGPDSLGVFPAATLTTVVNNNVIKAGQCIAMYPTLNWPGGTSGFITNVDCYNNTLIVLAAGSASCGILIPTSPGKLRSYNNIVTGAATQLGEVFYVVGAQGLIDYNMYTLSNQSYVYAPASNGTGYQFTSSLATFRTNMGSAAIDANSILTNSPGFVNAGPGALQYTTPSGSAAFNAGRVGGTGSTPTNMGALNTLTIPGSDF